MKNFFEDKYKLFLIVLSIIFFVTYLFLSIDFNNFSKMNFFHQPDYLVFNQPDESANYFFIRKLVVEKVFRVGEDLSFLTLNQLHPRSMTVVQGTLVPIGFPGVVAVFSLFTSFFVYIFGSSFFNLALVSLVPLLGAVTPLFFYGFLKKIFNRRVAFFASLLLFINPAWWYYASRSLQHTIIFIFFVVSSLYFATSFVYCHDKRKSLFAFLWAFLFGVAILIRPIEFLWLGPLLLFFLVYLRKNLTRNSFLFFLLGAFLSMLIFALLQIIYYGSIWSTGYAFVQENGMAGNILDKISSNFFLFGFSVKAMLKNTLFYSGLVFPVWLFVYFLSFVYLNYLLLKKNLDKKKYKILFGTFVFTALCLIFYYGSSSFVDNLSMQYSIGSSQVRYFMPLYLFGTVFIAFLFEFLFKKVKYFIFIFFAVLFIFSIKSVFYDFEGLLHIKSILNEYNDIKTEIVQNTEDNSIIVTRYADKYIFPDRRVITSVEDKNFVPAIKNLLLRGYKVYIFDLFADKRYYENMSFQLDLSDISISEDIFKTKDSVLQQIFLK
ncbi:MAG: hypothetical protein A2493_00845 [Candidatus Magasanikbacteria bacterium RIFOXYC12_FULL_33_11]|uniref:Glycosyltransferase RgtA/B/C/D-like domain-containing protein n=1 Tax=Candidatus Magasanikbacteria bacterium RIFOXYC12_FULL_33_11 TaxID=1798701 RepID=A0A1F6NM61_9BACT|nr:MAG: hypothetical protein A2493_00845 [Candidatus Magasanikbacteria bacterium RIFOXYC12_FULL_33_11]